MKTSLRPRDLALLALACGLAASLLAWYVAGRLAEREGNARSAARADVAAGLIERRIQRYIDVLHGVEALALHDSDLSRAEFRGYVAALELDRRFPGVKAVELVRRVSDAERDAFVESVRTDRSLSPFGYPDFDIRPAGRRAEYWVVDYVEPPDGNEPIFGLDMRTRLGAASAAERALRTGRPTATGRYRLVSGAGAADGGLTIYLPVSEAASTPDERLANARAFVDVVLRMDQVLSEVLSEPAMAGIQLQIRDLGRRARSPRPAPRTPRSTEAPPLRSPAARSRGPDGATASPSRCRWPSACGASSSNPRPRPTRGSRASPSSSSAPGWA